MPSKPICIYVNAPAKRHAHEKLRAQYRHPSRRLIDTQTLHAITQRAECDAEQLGSRSAVVACFFERAQDSLLFDAVKMLLQWQPGQIAGRDLGVSSRRRR